MTYVLAFLISLVAGWLLAACDALFRAEDRTGIFGGTYGTVFLLVVTGAGGLLVAGALIWILKTIITATVIILIGFGGYFGATASNRLHVTAPGAANRLIVGLAVMAALYAIAWIYFPPGEISLKP